MQGGKRNPEAIDKGNRTELTQKEMELEAKEARVRRERERYEA